MENDIKKLFENMKMLNPDFTLNELDTFNPTYDNSSATFGVDSKPEQNTQATQPSDVKYLANVQNKATQVTKAGTKINTSTEFSGAFKNWFSTLGYTPEGNVVTISRVLIFVKQALTELGYK